MAEEVDERESFIEKMGSDAATATAEPPKEPETPAPEPVPATPEPAPKEEDKFEKLAAALAKNQMEVSALSKRLEANGNLSDKELKKLHDAETRGQEIQDDLAPILDPNYVGDPDLGRVAKRAKTIESKIESTDSRLAAVEAELAEEKRLRAQAELSAKYPAVNRDEIWKKSCEDALSILGDDSSNTSILRLANSYFHERCTAAQARAKDPAAKAPERQATNRPPPAAPIKPPSGTPAITAGGAPQAPQAFDYDSTRMKFIEESDLGK